MPKVPTVTSVTYTPTSVTGKLGDSWETLSKSLPTKISDITVSNGDKATILKTLAVAWNKASYDPTITTKQIITGVITSTDSSVAFASGVDKPTVTAVLTPDGKINVTQITMSGTSVTGSVGDAWDTIVKKLPTVKDIVISSGDKAVVQNTLKVSWNSAGYDSTKTTVQTVTGTVTSSDPNVIISSTAATQECNVQLLITPSSYDKTEKGAFDDDDDHKKVGITSVSLSKKLVGEILDYVYANGTEAVKAKIKSIMDAGHKLSIAVLVTKLDSSDVDGKDAMKKKARSFDGADSAELVAFYDISLYITDNEKYEANANYKITNAGKSVTFEYTVPDSVKSTSSSSSMKRYYNVVTYHDGDAHGTGRDYTTDTKFEFEAKDFSTFATAYYDKSSSSSSSSKSSSSSTKGSSSLSPSTGGGGSTTTSGKSPKTGDDFSFLKWLYFVLIGGTIIYSSVTLLKDTHDDVDE